MSNSTTLIINGPLTGTGIIQIDSGSTLELNGSVSSTQTIQFVSSDANLILNDPAEFLGTISSFSLGDTIDLAGLPFGSDSIAIGNGVLSIIDGSSNLLASLNLDTATSNESFQLTSDGSVGSQITAVACFLKDTLISTKIGKLPVQELKIGDNIFGSDNREHPIKWIGRRTFRQPFKPSDRSIFPICIRKSAFSKNVPSENLFLSPEHSVFIENVLIPAKFLVNGVSIKIVDNLSEISYYHIELETHEIILAQDTEVESFIDSESRAVFENYDEFLKLYPLNRNQVQPNYFRKLETSSEAKVIRDKLAAKAGCKMPCPDDLLVKRFEGFLDHASRQYIRGWAWLPDLPFGSAELEVFVDDECVAKIIASHFRTDLLNARIGNGCHGFELHFSPPLSSLSHFIDVRLSGTLLSITGSPVVFEKQNLELSTHYNKLTCENQMQMTGLILDTMWPDEMRDAGSNAVLNHIKIFQRLGFNIDFRATDICTENTQKKLFKLNISAKTHDQYPTVEALLQAESSKYSFVYFHRLDIAKRYAGIVRAISRDYYGRSSRKIYSIADLQFLRVLREADCKNDLSLANEAKALFRDEFLAIHQVDTVITHSSVEAELIRKKFPSVTPNVVPWALRAYPKASSFKSRNGIGFLGSFDHSPNRDAIEYLLYKIMPLLWESDPRITLKIFGSGWTQSCLPKLDTRVSLIGSVENLHDALSSVRVTVAPLRFGAGLKGKVLESLAIGIPCVMSACAAEGICLPAEYNDLVCNFPSQIVRQLINLHSSKILNDSFSKIGQDMTRNFYNERAISKLMEEALIQSFPNLMKSPRVALNVTAQ